MLNYIDCSHELKCTHGLLCTYLHPHDEVIKKCECQLDYIKSLDILENYAPLELVYNHRRNLYNEDNEDNKEVKVRKYRMRMCKHKEKCPHVLLCTFGHTHIQCLDKCTSQLKFFKSLNNNNKYVPSLGLRYSKHKPKENINVDVPPKPVELPKPVIISDIKVNQKIKTKICWADFSENLSDDEKYINLDDIILEDV